MAKERRDKDGKIKDTFWQKFKSWRLGRKIRLGHVPRGRQAAEVIKAINDTCSGLFGEIWGLLSIKVFHGDGTETDYGVVSTQKVTTAFRDRMVAALQNSTTSPMDVFKYHGCGTGTTAEANTQTALVTEVGSRVSGTQATDGNAYVYRSVATITPGGVYSITEHGLFSASTSGTLMDRSLFTAIGVTATDSIQFTYDCTFSAEA